MHSPACGRRRCRQRLHRLRPRRTRVSAASRHSRNADRLLTASNRSSSARSAGARAAPRAGPCSGRRHAGRCAPPRRPADSTSPTSSPSCRTSEPVAEGPSARPYERTASKSSRLPGPHRAPDGCARAAPPPIGAVRGSPMTSLSASAQASGSRDRRPRSDQRAKSRSRLQSSRPCSMATAARCASVTSRTDGWD